MDKFADTQHRKTSNDLVKKVYQSPKSFVTLLLICLVIAAVGCSFKKPSAPSWDVEVSVPLISKRFTMAKIAEDEDAVVLNSDSTLAFEQTSELDNYEVGEQLDVEDMSDFFSLELGSIDIDSPGSNSTQVELREIFSNAEALDGQSSVISSFNFTTEKKQLDSYDEFRYAIIESGTLTITVQNDLVVPLGNPITLEIWDTEQDSLILTSVNDDQIAAGQTQSFGADLAGVKLPSNLSILMSAFSPGSNGSSVPIDASSRFVMTGTISALTVSEAMAKVPEQQVSSEDHVTIQDSMVVMEAVVETGTINLELTGDMPLDAWMVYELPDFYRQGGQALVDSFFIRQRENVAVTINLQGFSLRPQDADFSQQQVQFNWRIRTIDTEDNYALVKSTDVMNASFELGNLQFSSVTGKIGQQDIDVTQDDIEFDIPADLDSIFFETAELELSIDNAIQFPARLQFAIHGQNENGDSSNLSVDEVIQPADEPGVAKRTVIALNQNNSNIKDFISILPNLIQIQGQVALGDPSHVGTISNKDFVSGSVRIRAPLSLRLPPQAIETDPNELDMNDDTRENIVDNASNSSFFAELDNALPLGATVEVFFGLDTLTMFNEPDLKIGPLRAEPPQISNDGYVTKSSVSELSFALTEQQMLTFAKKGLYSAVRVSIDGTDGKFIKVRAEDYLQLKAYTQVLFKVNDDN